jgi:hypothetical protein
MIGHQHVGVNPATGLAGILGQPIEIAAIILIGKKAGLVIIASLDEVDGNIGQRDAGTARHDELRCMGEGGQSSKDQETVVCPLLFRVPYCFGAIVSAKSIEELSVQLMQELNHER